MAEGELGERTEQPTSKRLGKARNDGQVPKSQDLSAAFTLLIGVMLFAVLGSTLIAGFTRIMARELGGSGPGFGPWAEGIPTGTYTVAIDAAQLALPSMIIIFIAAVIAQLAQVGILFTTKPLMPKLSKLNPIQGVKRVFGKRGLVKSGINILKLSVLLGVATLVLVVRLEEIGALPRLHPAAAYAVLLRMLVELALILIFVLLLIAIIDYIYQRWQHKQDLKMTKQEVKDERKSMEGDPQIKQARMRAAQEILKQRIGQSVPQADVIVANPTHFSVALQYDRETMSAPTITAKGADEVALRIRYLAARANVPIVARPPLARALYFGAGVGETVAPEHYEAVAEVLAYVYRINGTAAEQADELSREAQPEPALVGA
ncbi:MAG: flagellar biosynthesis protein FlhB [Planctomycetota bacterium]